MNVHLPHVAPSKALVSWAGLPGLGSVDLAAPRPRGPHGPPWPPHQSGGSEEMKTFLDYVGGDCGTIFNSCFISIKVILATISLIDLAQEAASP